LTFPSRISRLLLLNHRKDLKSASQGGLEPFGAIDEKAFTEDALTKTPGGFLDFIFHKSVERRR
jgi:hypothetical protein